MMRSVNACPRNSHLLFRLSQKFTAEYGGGFSERNLQYMRRFYLVFPDRNVLRWI